MHEAEKRAGHPERGGDIEEDLRSRRPFLGPGGFSDRLTPMEDRLRPEDRSVMGPTYPPLRGWMVLRDPPLHRRLREPVRRVFTHRRSRRAEDPAAWGASIVGRGVARLPVRID